MRTTVGLEVEGTEGGGGGETGRTTGVGSCLGSTETGAGLGAVGGGGCGVALMFPNPRLAGV